MNTLTDILFSKGVKYTSKYADNLVKNNPQKNNMLGLIIMLKKYGVQSIGCKCDKRKIKKLPLPFITLYENKFITIERYSVDEVQYRWNGKKKKISYNEFNEKWTGYALLVEKDEKSCEPNYEENKRKQLENTLVNVSIVSATVLFFLLAIIKNWHIDYTPSIPMILLAAVGLFLCSILMMKQLHKKSKMGETLCSFLSAKGCNNVIESNAGKILDYSWTEIGLAYFSTIFSIIIFFPSLHVFLCHINFFSLPFSLWSIAYQWRKKKWCTLCILVQLVLISIVVTSTPYIALLFSDFPFRHITVYLLLLSGIYLVLVCINKLMFYKKNEAEYKAVKLENRRIKTNETVFSSLLVEQSFYQDAINMQSCIHWGNPKAEIKVTILSNPFCKPCATLHHAFTSLMKENPQNLYIQYFLTSFNQELMEYNRNLIHVALHYSNEEKNRIYDEWYKEGRFDPMVFALKYSYDKKEKATIEEEMGKHKLFEEKTKIEATPTVLVNGYSLPQVYDDQDLVFYLSQYI